MKVRWSQRCAGGCGLWLTVGAQAVRRHRSYWCPGCWITHQQRCGVCAEAGEQEPVREPVSAGQPLLW